ncbi:hypothetical protein BC941DRAFT_509493, partial [Chlamydoabsidia padenii]
MNQFDSFSKQLIDTLLTLQAQIDDISLKQKDLVKLITDAQDGSLTTEEYADVKMMMDRTSAYNTKLLSLRTTMVNMSLKSKQLLKRSDKLKATKLDYLAKVGSIRRLEQERDQTIAAKVSEVDSPTPSPTATIPEMPQSTCLAPKSSPSSDSLATTVKRKKKKKPKAREVEIGDDGPAWIPKRTLSTTLPPQNK